MHKHFLGILFSLFLGAAGTYSLTFDLSSDADAGYETGLYNPTDSAYSENSLFLGASIEPLWSGKPGTEWSTEAVLPASTVVRKTTGNDYSIGPGLALIREWERKTLRLEASGEYVSQAGTLDPDQPTENMLYGLSAELGRKANQNLKFSYFLTYLDEIGSNRRDIANKIRLKVGFKPSDWVLPGIGAGVGLNTSTIRDYRYKELNLSTSLLLLPDNKNTWFFMAYWSRRQYPGDTRQTKQKATVNATGKKIKNPANITDNSMISASYTRTLSSRLDMEMTYDFILYRSGLTRKADISHKIAVGLSWRLNPL